MSTDDQEGKVFQKSLAHNYSPTDSEIELAELSERFIEEHRKGRAPSVEEYAKERPEFASDILELFPTLLLLEKSGESAALLGSADDFTVKGVEPPKIERLKNFRIVREIGRGGMGVVYEAWDEELDRPVALKVMKIFPSEKEQTILRFQREARIAARLHHTNIVPVYGSDMVDDQFYYAMQLIDGESLEQYLLLKERETRRPSNPKREPPAANRFKARYDQTRDGFAKAQTTSNAFSTPVGQLGALDGVDKIRRYCQTTVIEEKTEACPVLSTSSELETRSYTKERERQNAKKEKGARKRKRKRFHSPKTYDNSLAPLVSSSPLISVRIAKANYYQRVADLGVQAANALDYAHRHDVVHRDIKPSNLIVDYDGVLWITDFGLARSTAESRLTRHGQLVGTLRYLAPEALEGKFSQQSDVYSLGLTLYELLTFTPAFDESNYTKLFMQVSAGAPARPRKLNPQIPPDLETIVLKAIDYSPENRYTAGEMADDLRRFLDERPIKARRLYFPELVWRWGRRNKLAASLAATVVLLTILFMIVLGSSYVKKQGLLKEKEREAIRANQNVSLALEAFDGIYDKLLSKPENAQFSVIDEAGALFMPLADVSISAQTSLALDEMLAFYGKFVQVNADTHEDHALQLRSARAFFRTGLIRVMQGEMGYFSAFDQAFRFYQKSLESAPSHAAYADAAWEMGQLVFELIRCSPADEMDGNELEKYCSAALEAIARVKTPIFNNRERSLEARIHFIRATHRLKRIRKATRNDLFAKPDVPMPSEPLKALIQKDFDFVRRYVQTIQDVGAPRNSGELDMLANYYRMLSIWHTTLRQPEEALAAVGKGRRIVNAYQKTRASDSVAYNNLLKLEYARLRVIFECQIQDPNEELRTAALKKFRELENQFLSNPNQDESFPDDANVMLTRIFGSVVQARFEASQNNLEQTKAFLDLANEETSRFIVERPNFEIAPIQIQIYSLYAELFLHEKSFDEAEAHVTRLEELFHEWETRCLHKLEEAEKQLAKNDDQRLSEDEKKRNSVLLRERRHKRRSVETTSKMVKELRKKLDERTNEESKVDASLPYAA